MVKSKDTNNEETIIYADWMIVKEEIWTSWYGFLNNLADLLIYQQQGKFSGVTYSLVMKNFISVYMKIGVTRFKKYVLEDELETLKQLYDKVLVGGSLEVIELNAARIIFEKFFSDSGMDMLDNEKGRSPSLAVNDVFKQY